MTDNKNRVDAFGLLPSDPALSIEEGWVRDLQTICAAAQCSTPGVPPGEGEALARRAIRAADEADGCGRPVLEAWPDGQEFTSDDLRVLAAGFRRSEVPEPSADWDRVHDRPADIYTPPEDRIVRPSPEPQGEPSDAQVLAALNGFYPHAETSNLSDWSVPNRDAMRRALRAAGGVR